jgi:cysteine desulfurase
VGALVVRRGTPLVARVLGGGQELERRAGSHHVAGIAGLGAAAAEVVAQRDATDDRVAALAGRLRAGLRAVPGVDLTVGDDVDGLPNVVHVLVEGVVGEEAVFLLDERGIAASAGSSCASGALAPSHVLAAMGLAPEVARGALRLSLGWCSTDADVDEVLAVLPDLLERLRVDSGPGGVTR